MEGFSEVVHNEGDVDLLLELLDILDLSEAALLFQLSSHRHVGCLPAQIGDICA